MIFLLQKINIGYRLQKLGVEKAILIFVISIAFLFSFPPFNRSIPDDASMQYYFLEIFTDFLKWLLLFLTIYIFYRINHYLLVEKVFRIKGIFFYFFAFIGLAMLFFPIFGNYYR